MPNFLVTFVYEGTKTVEVTAETEDQAIEQARAIASPETARPDGWALSKGVEIEKIKAGNL